MTLHQLLEGFYATKNAYKLIETHGNEFNIISSAYQILYENSNPKTTIEKLTEKLD